MQRISQVLFENTWQKAPQKQCTLKSSQQLNDSVSHRSEINLFLRQLDYQPAELPAFLLSQASEAFRVLQGREIWRNHGDWISTHNPRFAPDIAERFKWCASLTKEDEQKARSMADEVNSLVSNLLADNSIFIMPTTPGPAPLLSTSAEDLVQYRNQLLGLTALAGLGGLPQLQLPLISDTSNLVKPAIGLSLLGNKNTDLQLISTAMKLTGGKLAL